MKSENINQPFPFCQLQKFKKSSTPMYFLPFLCKKWSSVNVLSRYAFDIFVVMFCS